MAEKKENKSNKYKAGAQFSLIVSKPGAGMSEKDFKALKKGESVSADHFYPEYKKYLLNNKLLIEV